MTPLTASQTGSGPAQSPLPAHAAHAFMKQRSVTHSRPLPHRSPISFRQREFRHLPPKQSLSREQGDPNVERQVGAEHCDPGQSGFELHSTHTLPTHRLVAQATLSVQAPPVATRQSPPAQAPLTHWSLPVHEAPSLVLQTPALSHAFPGAGQESGSLTPRGTLSHWPVEPHT
jgi:hypothetical protein